ncbi:hypothetical protein WJX74_000232 [Apatococcus lobatus]|uniref:Ankyrin repeat protein n=1 Tax=Apatococcus lobatus TaxID=904363 RepID=A0AAW1RGV5_9CHLO
MAMELPKNGEGLSWIASREPSQLLLIPGLRAASITAAGAADHEAVAYLRFAAQNFAAHGPGQHLNELDRVCLRASHISGREECLLLLEKTQGRNAALYKIYRDRRNFTANLHKLAIYEGQVAALRWLQAICHRFVPDTTAQKVLMENAASSGHLDMLKHLRSGRDPFPLHPGLVHAAASHHECLVWLLTQQPPCPFDPDMIVMHVASVGSLQTLAWLHCQTQIPAACWKQSSLLAIMLIAAARRDGLPIIQWLPTLDSLVPWGQSPIYEIAAANGRLSLLQWLTTKDPMFPWSDTCALNAAINGHWEIVRWAHAQRLPCLLDERCTFAAVKFKDQSMLRWLRDLDPPCAWNADSCSCAAEHGDLQMLQLLCALQPPCPMDSAACTRFAACNGDLPMLIWLVRNQRTHLEPMLYLHAAHGGHLHVMRWLYSLCLSAPDVSAARASAVCSTAALMFLGDIGARLDAPSQQKLMQARKTLCTFRGLVRWCRDAVSNPSKGIHRAFDPLATDAKGEHLLVRLSMLPQELVDRIAVAAALQHDLM